MVVPYSGMYKLSSKISGTTNLGKLFFYNIKGTLFVLEVGVCGLGVLVCAGCVAVVVA